MAGTIEEKIGGGLEVDIRRQMPANGGPGFRLEARFSAPPGITILFGPSGAGKTTVLECIAGLADPDSGRIRVGEGVSFDSGSGVSLPAARRSVGYVFQSLALFPHLTVEQNVGYGLAHLETTERRRRVGEILEAFHIAHLAQRRPREISGGESQRVALARALVIEPAVLLLDEPLSGLDAAIKARLMDDLRESIARRRIPVLYVTHDRGEVFALGERMVFLHEGKVVAEGLPHEVLGAPRLEPVALAAGFENIFDATVVESHEEQGTMTCRLGQTAVHLEAPLGRFAPGAALRLAVRAGDILVAAAPPSGLSARNILAGRISALNQVDATVVARVDCGVEFEVHLTPGAVRALALEAGKEVWLVLKTYSCHLVEGSAAA